MPSALTFPISSPVSAPTLCKHGAAAWPGQPDAQAGWGFPGLGPPRPGGAGALPLSRRPRAGQKPHRMRGETAAALTLPRALGQTFPGVAAGPPAPREAPSCSPRAGGWQRGEVPSPPSSLHPPSLPLPVPGHSPPGAEGSGRAMLRSGRGRAPRRGRLRYCSRRGGCAGHRRPRLPAAHAGRREGWRERGGREREREEGAAVPQLFSASPSLLSPRLPHVTARQYPRAEPCRSRETSLHRAATPTATSPPTECSLSAPVS